MAPHPPGDPDPWITRHAHLLPPGGRALDVACGTGRHARFLAALGLRVVAVDVDVAGVADLAGSERVEVRQADLESAPWPFADGGFDAVVVTNYLHRPLLGDLARALAPGGVLLYATFAAGNERYGRPRDPRFLLQPGELLEAFGGALQVVAYEHGLEAGTAPAVRQRLCAVRADGPVPLRAPG